MADAFEKQKIHEYIRNLLRTEGKNSSLVQDVAEWVSEYPDIFDLAGNAAPEKNEGNSVEMAKSRLKWLKTLLQSSRKTQKQKPPISELENIIREISGLLQLTAVEQSTFGVFVRIYRHSNLNSLVKRITGNDRKEGQDRLSVFEATADLTGRKIAEITAVIRLDGKLVDCGLISASGHDFDTEIEIDDPIKTLFSVGGQHFLRDELRAYLLGEPVAAKLAWQDYSHLGLKREFLERMLRGAIQSGSKGINILVHGKTGTGKTEFCTALAEYLGVTLYSACEEGSGSGAAEQCNRLQRLRRLQEILFADKAACIMVDNAEELFHFAEEGSEKKRLIRLLEENNRPVIWVTHDATDLEPTVVERMSFCLEMDELPADVRVSIVREECSRQNISVAASAIQEFVREYALSPVVLANAVRSANLAGEGFEGAGQVLAYTEKLLGIAKPNETVTDRFDLNLVNTDLDLARVTEAILHNGRRDFSVYLAGPPGSGKSEFARWLAVKLNMEILVKKASDLKGKYVGETEKRIAGVFRTALTEQRILLFDEADSLLRDRRYATHTWEVSHVNEMLTWMERHPLPFICTTNLEDKIDEAAFRRFTFKAHFNYLRNEQMMAAFQRFFGVEAPQAAITCANLTPGDFAVVKKKCEYLGVVEATDICWMLRQETQGKQARVSSGAIGFRTE